MHAEVSPFILYVGEAMIDGHEDREPPDHVKAALLDTFGRERMENIRIYFHPILKRWMMLQKKLVEETTGHALVWECFWICSANEGIPDDYVPSDWREGTPEYTFLAQMAGQVGEQREPTRRDFETLMEWSSTRYNEDLEAKIAKKEADIEREHESGIESMDHDFLSHHDRIIRREANDGVNVVMNTTDTREGSGWSMLREELTHVVEEHPSGFKIRRRRTHEEREAIMAEWGALVKPLQDLTTKDAMRMFHIAQARAQDKLLGTHSETAPKDDFEEKRRLAHRAHQAERQL
ncbi:MAG: hypothetical protein ACRBI6_04480 [Acidimicrobiales bacterium]